MTGIVALPLHRGITEVEFCAWLTQAAPGDVLEYHRGFLGLDRTPFGSTMDTDARHELTRVSARAMRLVEQGMIHLVQRRLGPDRFSYLAIARPRTGTAPMSFAILMTEEAA